MLCPKCGSEMVERIAKSGKNRGLKFWGCSKYPVCKEIVNISSSNEEADNTIDTFNDQFARYFYAEPITDDFETSFFESIAVPQFILKELSNDEIDYNVLLNQSKFRVDLIKKSGEDYYSNQIKTIFSLYLKILNRGSITLNSHIVEDKLKALFLPNDNKLADELENIKNFVKEYDNVWNFDSHNEEYFYNNILKKIFGKHYNNYITPQAYLNSLTNQSNAFDFGQRVDFLVSDGKTDFIIELDGEEHSYHQDKDLQRLAALLKENIESIRIKNNEIDDFWINAPESFNAFCKKIKNQKFTDSFSNERKFLVANKIVHQIQVALAKGLERGCFRLNDVFGYNLKSKLFSIDEIEQLYQIAISDLNQTLNKLFSIYSLKENSNIKFSKLDTINLISFGQYVENKNLILINDFNFSKKVKPEIEGMDKLEIIKVNEKDILYFLEYIFRFKNFQEEQFNSIERTLLRNDSIVLLPTGAGKSLIFQLSSILLTGTTIVISPITSLMDDQIQNLNSKGIDKAVIINANISKELLNEKDIIDNSTFLVYISPERLQIPTFRENVNRILVDNHIPLVAIDEAHCVSEWGHDFRTSYLNIGKRVREIFRKQGAVPTVLALTGTASTSVLKDVKRELNIEDYNAIITPKTFDRPELKFSIENVYSEEKIKMIIGIIEKKLPNKFRKNKLDFFKLANEDTFSGIIFAPFVNGEHGIVSIEKKLAELPMKSDIYSGSAPKTKQSSWNEKKKEAALSFKSNKINLLVATKAYGMGIDKPNIRYTIHYGLPSSIESLYQEAGRAGRDRKHSECVIIYSNHDHNKNEKLLDLNLSLSELKELYNKSDRSDSDDINRALYFHLNSFLGIDYEIKSVEYIIEQINNNNDRRKLILVPQKHEKLNEDQSKLLFEKAIQRMVVLGVVSDYLVDYSSYEYTIFIASFDKESILNNYIKYVKGYNEGRSLKEKIKLEKHFNEDAYKFLSNASKMLIEFIYDTIEKGRRRGVKELVQLANASTRSKDQDSSIRNRIIRYFESSYSEDIDAILDSKDLGFLKIQEIFDGFENEIGESVGGVKSYQDAEKVRGQVSRYLESTPDHPGLLFLRALSEAYSKNYDINLIVEDYRNAINFSLDRYEAKENELINFCVFFLKKLAERNNEIYNKAYEKTIELLNIEKVCQAIIRTNLIEYKFKKIPIATYFNIQAEKTLKVFKEKKGE